MPALKNMKRDMEEIRFSRAAFGYRSSEVDNFIDDMLKKTEEALVEREELMNMIENLRSEVSTLQHEKDAITRAILNSEKIAQASVIDAGVKSKYILKDASEKAAKMVNTANGEYEKKLNEARKLNNDIETFVNDCIQKFGSQIEAMKSFSRIPIATLDVRNFEIDEVAKKFIANDDDSTSQIFSDSPHIDK